MIKKLREFINYSDRLKSKYIGNEIYVDITLRDYINFSDGTCETVSYILNNRRQIETDIMHRIENKDKKFKKAIVIDNVENIEVEVEDEDETCD